MKDRNFDDLVERFSKNIYQSLKGKIRLSVVRRDLQERVPEITQGSPLRILDAGGGLGVYSAELAQQGHQVVYCDISKKMLNAAREGAKKQGVADAIQFYHESIQSILQRDTNFQLVLMHAVLEWLGNPKEVLDQVIESLPSGAKLSLLFYNQQSIVFRNLLRGNFFRATSENQKGDKGSLTPSNPLNPDDVKQWVAAHNVTITAASGVRVFYDYGEKDRLAQRTPEQIIATEIEFSRREPYRSLGRYYHLIIENR